MANDLLFIGIPRDEGKFSLLPIIEIKGTGEPYKNECCERCGKKNLDNWYKGGTFLSNRGVLCKTCYEYLGIDKEI